MTSRGPGIAPGWLVAPVAAGTFALATQWALHHDPLQPAAPQAQVARDAAASTAMTAVQHDARLAARRLARAQVSVLRLQAAVQRRASRADQIGAVLRTAGHRGAAIPVTTLRTPPSAIPSGAPNPDATAPMANPPIGTDALNTVV